MKQISTDNIFYIGPIVGEKKDVEEFFELMKKELIPKFKDKIIVKVTNHI